MYLAQFNVSKLLHPLSDPRLKDFVDNIKLINDLANRIDGFIHRIQDKSGNALNIQLYDDERIIPNLTVWKDEASLALFVFKTAHNKFLKRGEEWFDKSFGSKNVMWFIEENYTPVMQDGVDRLAYMETHGETSYAFKWKFNSK